MSIDLNSLTIRTAFFTSANLVGNFIHTTLFDKIVKNCDTSKCKIGTVKFENYPEDFARGLVVAGTYGASLVLTPKLVKAANQCMMAYAKKIGAKYTLKLPEALTTFGLSFGISMIANRALSNLMTNKYPSSFNDVAFNTFESALIHPLIGSVIMAAAFLVFRASNIIVKMPEDGKTKAEIEQPDQEDILKSEEQHSDEIEQPEQEDILKSEERTN